MTYWIYFATAEKASLASTIETVVNTGFLWRSAFNERGARIANVGAIQKGDHIVIAWRQSRLVRTAYLDCTVVAPVSPLVSGLVIDRLAGSGAEVLISAGYPKNCAGEVEGIRLEDIRECYYRLTGKYGGNNTIHKLATEDMGRLPTGLTIPPEELRRPSNGALSQAFRPQIPLHRPTSTRSIVDYVTFQAMTDSRAFDAYAMVDWSSSSSPATGNDSIWIASGAWSDRTFIAGPPQNVPTSRRA